MDVKDRIKILARFWRGTESHTFLRGQLHHTRSTIGVGMTVEAISTWDRKHKAESITRLGCPHQADRSHD